MSGTQALPLWRRPLPRSWTVALASVIAIAGMVLLVNGSRLHVYLKHFGAKLPGLSIDYARLSSDMDEKAVLAHFSPVSLRCIDESKQVNKLGDRVCYASLDAVDAVPALTLAVFLDRGRLAHCVIHVPWWSSHTMARNLMEKLGPPEAFNEPEGGDRLIQWRAARGLVLFNRDPGWDPLGWSAVHWQALPAPRKP